MRTPNTFRYHTGSTVLYGTVHHHIRSDKIKMWHSFVGREVMNLFCAGSSHDSCGSAKSFKHSKTVLSTRHPPSILLDSTRLDSTPLSINQSINQYILYKYNCEALYNHKQEQDRLQVTPFAQSLLKAKSSQADEQQTSSSSSSHERFLGRQRQRQWWQWQRHYHGPGWKPARLAIIRCSLRGW